MAPEQKRTYAIFQGLLTVLLLLFFYYQKQDTAWWSVKFGSLSASLIGLLAFIRLAPVERLGKNIVQALLLLADVLLASLTLYWSQNPQSDLYLAYFIIILGAALLRNLRQCFLVALFATVFYLLSSWQPQQGLPQEAGFWLRIPFLWVMAFLAGILSQDVQQVHAEDERVYRQRLLDMERLATMGRLAGEMAHRIKGPLTSIQVNAETLLIRSKQPGFPPEAEEIRGEVLHCAEILKGLLRAGRVEDTLLEPLDLGECVKAALRTAHALMIRQKVRLKMTGLGRRARIIGDKTLLQEAVFALVQNALEAMPRGGTLELSLRPMRKAAWWAESGEALDFFELSVKDSGQGIDPKLMGRIFEPFFSTKSDRGGTGLGLCAALRILQNHSGFIEAQSAGPRHGACFVVSIPRFERV